MIGASILHKQHIQIRLLFHQTKELTQNPAFQFQLKNISGLEKTDSLSIWQVTFRIINQTVTGINTQIPD